MGILSDPTPDMLAIPRFDDDTIDMQELLRRLAEQVVNAVMNAEAPHRSVCKTKPKQHCCPEQAKRQAIASYQKMDSWINDQSA